jgi:DNA-binding MltR family transcriptional regulator
MKNNNFENIKDRLIRVIDFRRSLSLESDRGCALMSAAFLEIELENELKYLLVKSRKIIDKIFEFNGPLGNFSSKISMAFALGLIDRNTLNELDLIRKIRNKFAHEHQSISFDDETLAPLIEKLNQNVYVECASHRERFIKTSLFLLSSIHATSLYKTPFIEKSNVNLDNEYKKKIEADLEPMINELLQLIIEQNITTDSAEYKAAILDLFNEMLNKT